MNDTFSSGGLNGPKKQDEGEALGEHAGEDVIETLRRLQQDRGETRPLTILQLTPELNVGGVERGAVEIAQAVAAAGGRAIIASAGGRMETKLKAVGGESVVLPLAAKNPIVIERNAARLTQLIKDESVDIVHARSRAPAWSGYWAAQRSGAHFITTYHGAYSEGLPGKRAYNSVMAKGRPVIAISEFIADLVRTRHGTPPERIKVIPRGADLTIFDEAKLAPGRVSALARAWSVADDPRPVLMLPGRLTRWKGHEMFLTALGLLKERLGESGFQALIVGGERSGWRARAEAPGGGGASAVEPGARRGDEGRFELELRAKCAALGLTDMVRFVGHCDDMPSAYRLAAMVISASLEPEAFGRVAVEAQAMGAPVIAAAHGGAMETVADGETGFLFEPGEPEALAEAMAYGLSLSKAHRRAMGEAGVTRVRNRFSVATMQASTLQVYQEVAGRVF
ncbi:MAG: glycosyltransferase family 4 protein [Pseudomonadota bacterium]